MFAIKFVTIERIPARLKISLLATVYLDQLIETELRIYSVSEFIIG